MKDEYRTWLPFSLSKLRFLYALSYFWMQASCEGLQRCWRQVDVGNNLGVFVTKFQYSWHRFGISAWTLNVKRQRMFATKMTETDTKISKLSLRRLQYSSPTSPLRKIRFHLDILIVKKFHGLILVLSFDKIDANYLILIPMCYT